MENGAIGSGIQVWSSLPRETLGDYRELGFVHGSNQIEAETEFPHNDAEYAYGVGYDYGVTQRNPEAREYAAGQHGHNVGADASPEQRAAIVRRLLNGSEQLAWNSGRDYALHVRKFARSV